MIQIDGLSYTHFLDAIDKKKLPFLQMLIQREPFVLRQFYSGLPSATPAVQAELFYGVKSAIPAFKYYDRRAAQEWTMYNSEAADTIASKLSKEHTGLLEGGSSYSNIFSGGAAEAPFCIQSMKLDSIFKGIKLRRIFWFILINLEKVFRIIGLTLLEIGLAVFDFCKGILLRKKKPFKEFKFIFSRIGSCIVLRELIRIHVKIDIARGLPIIHANFIGYDEHSHRRNPDSVFAYRTLKGIDATIRALIQKAVRSDKRDYHIFIYSDHGQETSLSFIAQTGRTIDRAVREALEEGRLKGCRYPEKGSLLPHINLYQRSTGLLRRSTAEKRRKKVAPPEEQKIHLTAMGSLGHIYLPIELNAEEMHNYAQRLVNIAEIPLVFYRRGQSVICVSSAESGQLKDMAEKIFGADHPFREEVLSDMQGLCRHVDAGEFIISGWRANAQPITLSAENGSHGGPGSNETRGFVILPDTLADEERYLRPLDLRKRVRRVFDPRLPVPMQVTPAKVQQSQVIAVMSYNIHSCLGMDGKLFPARIARIIARYSPDIAALQEVARNMARTEGQDQVQLIAEMLGMHYCYFPVLQNGNCQYGLAVLSRFPIEHIKRVYLPQLNHSRAPEKRGLLRVIIKTPLGPLHLLNTHLSLNRRERHAQMKFIVDQDQPTELSTSKPLVFCGDLNATTGSREYKLLAQIFSDCQDIHPTRKSDATFFSSYPMLRLDHIFHSPQLVPVNVQVIDDWECRLASDHLPVIAKFLHDSHLAS